MPWAAIGGALGLVGSVGGALIGSNATSNAVNAQTTAANNATAAELSMFNTTQGNLAPYMSAGSNSLGQLMQQLGLWSANGNPTGTPAPGSPLALPTYGSTINGLSGPQNYGAAQYQQSPGYQWQLSQGLGAISNAASAQGGIQSGNTLKALQTYGQGLANQDFQQGYSNYLNNYQNAYSGNVANANTNFNRLYGLAGSGQNAAASLGGFSGTVAGQVGSNILGAGNAASAGAIAQGNIGSNLLNSLTAGTQSSPSSLQQIYAGLFGNNGGNGGYGLSADQLNPGGYGG